MFWSFQISSENFITSYPVVLINAILAVRNVEDNKWVIFFLCFAFQLYVDVVSLLESLEVELLLLEEELLVIFWVVEEVVVEVVVAGKIVTVNL